MEGRPGWPDRNREVSRGTRCDAGQVVLKGDLFKTQILILYVWRGS